MKKVLVISKDPNLYKQGNYYKELIDALISDKNLCIEINDFNKVIDFKKFDIIILSHSFIDIITDYISITRKFPFRYFPLLNIFRKFMLKSNYRIKELTNFNGKKIFFSKNDYKLIDLKIIITNLLNVNLFITHTKKAKILFHEKINCELKWIPFTVSKINFRTIKKKKLILDLEQI